MRKNKYLRPAKKKYDTQEKRNKFVSKKNNILTFKKPFTIIGGEQRSQIISTGLERDRESGGVKVIGRFYDSPWYKSIDALIKAIDWKQMEEMHSDD